MAKIIYVLKFYTNYIQNVVLSYVNMLPMAVIIQCAHILITWRKAAVPEDSRLFAIIAAIRKRGKNAFASSIKSYTVLKE